MNGRSSVEQLYAQAAVMTDAGARAAYLREACGGDMSLCRQVEALFASGDDSVAEAPLVNRQAAFRFDDVGERTGDRIGPYSLRRRLGEGAFGVVFEAEQSVPIRRTVALKILKPGMDARQILRRFEQEQQTLALMSHPFIARVLDAGATAAGRPYFVMELADGEPITSFGDRHRLTIRERLELFIKVTRAVHHAHQKGIIHRDLKPSNILVELAEGEAQPKVIDFGLARLLRGRSAAATFRTADNQCLGTPAYMSPEQALSGGQSIDIRSDIYSLGVLLFELLVGVTPFEPSPLDPPSRWCELIRDLAPVRPSARLAHLSVAAATRVAAARGVQAHELRKLIQRDLDWIVAKATAREPDRRYESAEAMADDVRRFLEYRPVAARPPAAVYLARRFIRRHRMLVGSAAAIAVALLAGSGAASWGWWLAHREARAAQRESQRAEQLNEILFLGLLRADPAQGRGQAYTVRDLLDDLGRDVEGRRQLTPDVESALRDMLSFIYRETGDYEKALHHGTRGLELARRQADDPGRVASFLVTLGEVYKELDQYDRAARHLEECVTLRRAFSGEDHPETIRAVLTLGRVRYQAGDQPAGMAIVSKALATARSQQDKPWGRDQLVRCLNMMEILLRDEGRAAEALVLNQERLHLNRTHRGANHPETLLAQTHLGALLTRLGRLEEARELLVTTLRSERLQLGDDYPLTLETMIVLARCSAQLGELDEAAALYDEAIALAGSRSDMDYPDRADWIRQAVEFNELHGRRGRANELRPLLSRIEP